MKDQYWRIMDAIISADGMALTVAFAARGNDIERISMTSPADAWQKSQFLEYQLRKEQEHSRWLSQQLEIAYKKRLGIE